MILQYSEILQYHLNLCLRAVYVTLTAAILRSMLGLCCDETYGAMTNYNNGDDDRDNDGNKDGNDDDNAASESGSDGPIFDVISTPWSRRGGSGDDDYGAAAAAHYVSTCRTIYLPYKDHIKDVP